MQGEMADAADVADAQPEDAPDASDPDDAPDTAGAADAGDAQCRVADCGSTAPPPVLPSFFDAAQMVQVTRMMEGTGIPVLLQRRRAGDPVIELDYARVDTEEDATARRRLLGDEGWEAWPPSPAPELAGVYAHDRAERARGVRGAVSWGGCPYLVVGEYSDPMDPRHDAATPVPKKRGTDKDERVVCVTTPDELEEHVRDVVIARLARDRAAPCRRLQSLRPVDLAALHARPNEVRELRAWCANLLSKLRLHGALEP